MFGQLISFAAQAVSTGASIKGASDMKDVDTERQRLQRAANQAQIQNTQREVIKEQRIKTAEASQQATNQGTYGSSAFLNALNEIEMGGARVQSASFQNQLLSQGYSDILQERADLTSKTLQARGLAQAAMSSSKFMSSF